MDDAAGTFAALAETTVFLQYFKEMPDSRQAGKVIYPLDEILLLCLLAVLAGSEAFTEIARFGERKLALLRRFRPFKDGTPAHDHLGDIFATLDAAAFQRCFVAWAAALTNTPIEVIAIDGKTSRRSHKKGVKLPIHMVAAFAARQRLVMGQIAVAEKSNEIVAIPALLDLMAIEGAVVTIDAMGCQRGIAQKIIDKKADYILALKGNQTTLHDDVKRFAEEQKANGFKDAAVSRHETIDGEHGRIETRTYTAFHDIQWLRDLHQGWAGLNGFVMVESQREIAGKISNETRFYITSLTLLANLIGPMIRDHWAIENSLHWILDMLFRDDECRVRTDNAPANFTTMKHMANNIFRLAAGKDSQRLKRKTASWDDDYLANLIAA
jgi:predicted transposase YbfD/YdcC